MKVEDIISGIAIVASWLAAPTVAMPRPKFINRILVTEGLQKAIRAKALMGRAQDLQEIAYSTPDHNRVFAEVGFNNTLEYLVKALKNQTGDYYDIDLQPAPIEILDPASLTVNGKTYQVMMMQKRSGVVRGTFNSTPIVPVANSGCAADDYPELAGAIALIPCSGCEYAVKSRLTGEAGGAAAVIYSPQGDGCLYEGWLGEEASVPTTLIAYNDSAEILKLLEGDKVVAADLDVHVTVKYSQNLIVTTKDSDQDNILLLGAHADSVAGGPGINDNGSGTIAILEIALQLAQFSTTNAVRFAWWTAEESGLLGSLYYAYHTPVKEMEKVRLYLNFDMVASPNYVLGVLDGDASDFPFTGPEGSGAAEKTFQDYFDAAGLSWVPSRISSNSDHDSISQAHVPIGGLFTGAGSKKTEEEAKLFGGTAGQPYDPNYHTPEDTVEKLNETCFLQMTRAIAHAVATYGTSWEGFPDRRTDARG